MPPGNQISYAKQSSGSNSQETTKRNLREFIENLIGEGSVLIMDEGGVYPAALVRRLVSHHSVLVHVGLEKCYASVSVDS